MSEDQIKDITDRCFKRHNAELKKAINLRVGLPIGLLCGLLGWVLLTMWNFNGQLSVIQKVSDTQTLSITIETTERKGDIKELGDKLDANIKWLIENMNTKYRGTNPLLSK